MTTINETPTILEPLPKVEKVKRVNLAITSLKPLPKVELQKYHQEDPGVYEIGVDEAGRGPLFGRVYAAAVILPKDDSFEHSRMKDSKKFHSKKKIEEVAEYIKQHAIAYSVSYEDEKTIDDINILQATQKCMHTCIQEVQKKVLHDKKKESIYLLIDGNYFNPITHLNKQTKKLEVLPYTTVEGGDNKYTCIAAASILAKVERDKYIDSLCQNHPELGEKYGIDTNKGYGAKKHLDGIRTHGITPWHRRTFGLCKEFV
jgi:ribonuclease HII